LDQVLAALPRVTDENVLVGFDTADDAGVYRLTPECALVQTVDFFTPIVDDPSTFGAIAAANALSDIYAMGARPLCALSIVAFPAGGDPELLREILRGGAEKMREAGCVILGGHSVADDEIKFGYAVTGTAPPSRVITNAGAEPGDVLVLTKPLGTGVIATALKRGIADPHHVEASVASMLELNREAAEALEGLIVHAMTDVTGFGLIGHAREMAVASGATLEIEAERVPLLAGAREYARAGALAGGLKNNREFASCAVETVRPIEQDLMDLFYDPQTSGGLLIALPEADAGRLRRRFPRACPVGRVVGKQPAWIRIL
jgi:selenide,water dikinase